MHLEDAVQHVRLVAPSLLQTDALGGLEVILELGLVVGVGTLLDDDTGTLTG